MIRSCVLALFGLVTFHLQVASQAYFQKALGRTGHDVCRGIVQTADSGFIAVGYTTSGGAGSHDVVAAKLDYKGNPEWVKAYGGVGIDQAEAICALSDGNFLIAGHTTSFGAGGKDFYLIKIDPTGTIIWTKAYGTAGDDHCNSVIESSTGDIFMAGHTNGIGAGSFDVYVSKITSTGSQWWAKSYGGPALDHGNSIVELPSGNLILAGKTNSFGFGDYDAEVMKLNPDGDTLWTKVYGGASWDEFKNVILTSDNELLFSGFTQSFDAHMVARHIDFTGLLSKIDTLGEPTWLKTYGISGNETIIKKVVETQSGDFTGLGYTGSFPAYDFYSISISSTGAIEWYNVHGSGAFEDGSEVIKSYDGGYVMAGYTQGFGAGNYDFYIQKTNAYGNVDCNIAGGALKQSDTIPGIMAAPITLAAGGLEFGPSSAVTSLTFFQDTLCMVVCGELASFTHSPDSICLGQSIALQSTTPWNPNFLWKQNGSTFSASQSLTYFPTATGSVEISLVATHLSCSNNDTNRVNIWVEDSANADFTWVQNGYSLDFSNYTLNASSWSWTFGDGGTDTILLPTHLYADTGTYSVCLTVVNECNTHSLCKEVPLFFHAIGDRYTARPNVSVGYTSSTLAFSDASGTHNRIAYNIYDFQGRIVRSGQFTGSHQVSILDLSSGLYIYELSSGGLPFSTGRFPRN